MPIWLDVAAFVILSVCLREPMKISLPVSILPEPLRGDRARRVRRDHDPEDTAQPATASFEREMDRGREGPDPRSTHYVLATLRHRFPRTRFLVQGQGCREITLPSTWILSRTRSSVILKVDPHFTAP